MTHQEGGDLMLANTTSNENGSLPTSEASHTGQFSYSESVKSVHFEELDMTTDNPGPSTTLRQTLGERHVNMIAFSTVVGVGLFLQNGRIINLAGPGMAFLAYPLMGTIIWSTQAALGEMTALFPIPGAIFELPCRFLDRSVGYTVGWMAWFAWVVIVAAEVDAVATLFDFSTGSVQWSSNGTNAAVWVTIFLVVVLLTNLLPVRWYGEIEYCIGVLKMLFIIGLIMFNIIINAQEGWHFKYYKSPWGFISRSFLNGDKIYTGGPAHLAGVWSALTVAIFSMMGFEAVSITAAENKQFGTRDGIKISTRKIAIRITILYTLATFVVGLNVAYDNPSLVDKHIQGLSGGKHSAFVIAAFAAGKDGWGSFFNAFFILSATSTAMNNLYLSSRVLHALALSNQAWPRWTPIDKFRDRLTRTNGSGVPVNAVLASGVFGLLAYLAAGKSPQSGLGRMSLNATVSMLIVYAIICVTFIRFKTIIAQAAAGEHRDRRGDLEQTSLAYSRQAAQTYPYRSHAQSLRSYYALFGCIIMIIFNGWRTFSPFSGGDFVASYISVMIFVTLVLTYRYALHRKAALQWALHPTMNLKRPTMVDPQDPHHGQDQLRLDGKEGIDGRAREIIRWIWVWMK